MEPITKRALDSFEEVKDVCGVEKKQERIEFMSSLMGGHQHRISLTLRKGRISGATERVNGHIHKIDLPVDEMGDILGFTGVTEMHKHRISFKVPTEKGKDKDKKK